MTPLLLTLLAEGAPAVPADLSLWQVLSVLALVLVVAKGVKDMLQRPKRGETCDVTRDEFEQRQAALGERVGAAATRAELKELERYAHVNVHDLRNLLNTQGLKYEVLQSQVAAKLECLPALQHDVQEIGRRLERMEAREEAKAAERPHEGLQSK